MLHFAFFQQITQKLSFFHSFAVRNLKKQGQNLKFRPCTYMMILIDYAVYPPSFILKKLFDDIAEDVFFTSFDVVCEVILRARLTPLFQKAFSFEKHWRKLPQAASP